jgi:UDPglucose 6-dehydrogenase
VSGPFKIAVVGDWHQASVVAACFAELGNEVVGITTSEEAAQRLGAAEAPVHEPGLDELLRSGLSLGRLRFSTDHRDGLAGADFALLAIDTPVGDRDESDLAPIFEQAGLVAEHASGPFVLCVTSQVPVGTCEDIAAVVQKRQPGHRISVAYVPEFLRLGAALHTFREADRWVVGCDDPAVAARVAELYEPLGRPIHRVGRRSAEMAKHACNAFLATSISFINQIADLCEATGADVGEVVQILRLDQRIGPRAYLSPGLGYTGGTLGREVRALQHLGAAHGVATDLFDSVDAVNARRVGGPVDRLRRLHGGLAGLRIAILGLTYKPGTSTLRRSPAIQLAALLQREGASVVAFDPLARLDGDGLIPGLELAADPVAAATGADSLVLVSPWQGIEEVDMRSWVRVMKRPVLVDTGNFIPAAHAEGAGLRYVGVGR